MVALGGIIGLVIVVFGIGTIGSGFKPWTLALIGLPAGAAMYTYQDYQEIREERQYELYESDVEAVESTVYAPAPDISDMEDAIEVTETLPELHNCSEIGSYLGKWEYKRITKNGEDVAEMNPTDTMVLSAEYSDTTSFHFQYDIEMLNKHSKGVFGLIEQDQNCAFVFSYFAPDGQSISQSRTFQISYFDGDSLCITEGPLAFEYRKK